MGCVARAVKRFVGWLGDIFSRVINWFKNFVTGVNNKTENVLMKREKEILQCENPKNVAEYMGAQSHHRQTKKIADDFGKKLSASDKAKADKLLEEEDFDWNR